MCRRTRKERRRQAAFRRWIQFRSFVFRRIGDVRRLEPENARRSENSRRQSETAQSRISATANPRRIDRSAAIWAQIGQASPAQSWYSSATGRNAASRNTTAVKTATAAAAKRRVLRMSIPSRFRFRLYSIMRTASCQGPRAAGGSRQAKKGLKFRWRRDIIKCVNLSVKERNPMSCTPAQPYEKKPLGAVYVFALRMSLSSLSRKFFIPSPMTVSVSFALRYNLPPLTP